MVFKAVAGNTIPTNNAKNPPSINPTMNNATERKIEPLTIVPKAAKTGALNVILTLFFTSKNKAKNTKAVIGLSIMLAICPPGADVVKADMIPVAMDRISTYFALGNSKIPRNIMDNSISGFTPKSIGGTTACKTAPIPTNRDKIINILVFIFNSPHLFYAQAFLFPTVHSLSVAKC